jgi:hypothetical protein
MSTKPKNRLLPFVAVRTFHSPRQSHYQGGLGAWGGEKIGR